MPLFAFDNKIYVKLSFLIKIYIIKFIGLIFSVKINIMMFDKDLCLLIYELKKKI